MDFFEINIHGGDRHFDEGNVCFQFASRFVIAYFIQFCLHICKQFIYVLGMNMSQVKGERQKVKGERYN